MKKNCKDNQILLKINYFEIKKAFNKSLEKTYKTILKEINKRKKYNNNNLKNTYKLQLILKKQIIFILWNFIFIRLLYPILTQKNFYKRRKLEFGVSIDLKVLKEENYLTKVINEKYIPDRIYINGILSDINNDGKVYLEEEEINNITMEWNQSKEICDKMFEKIINIIEIDLSKFDTSKVISMEGMFKNCDNLQNINFENFNTSLVNNMASMFENCISLESLDLSSFDTSKVTNMKSLFKNCHSLSSLDLSNFETLNLINMEYMFFGCSWLSDIIISNFDTRNVVNMRHLFHYCSSLLYLDLSNFDTSNVINMDSLFEGCSSLLHIDLSSFETKKVESMNSMFSLCVSFTSLNLSKIDTSSVTDMSFMFNQCINLISIDLSNFITSKVKKMDCLFSICTSLTSIDLSKLDVFNVVSMDSMFKNCFSLISIDLSYFDLSNKNLDYLFSDCTSLTSIKFSKKKQLVKSISSMFSGCHSLLSLDLSSFNFSLVENMDYLFYECYLLTSIDLSRFEVNSVTSISKMFSNCIFLEIINLTNFIHSNLTNIYYLFENCQSLKSLDLSPFNTSMIDNMNSLFYNCSKLESINLSSFDTSLVTDIRNMFMNCYSLTSLNLSSFNTSLVIRMSSIFDGCSSLISLDLSNFNMENIEEMYSFFNGCFNLKYIKLFSMSQNVEIFDLTLSGTSEYLIICIDRNSTEDLIPFLSSTQCVINNCSNDLSYNELKLVKDKNICLDHCLSDQIYKYEFKNYCYDKCPKGTHPMKNNTYFCEYYEYECIEEYPFLIIEYNSCTEECNCKDFFNDICQLNNNNIKSQSILISNIIKGIEDGLIDELLLEIINEEKDIIKIENNILYQITSSFNENNQNNQNISSINMSECEIILKEQYNIIENETLIIFKTEKYLDEILIPIIEFEVFNPKTKEKLNLNYCKNLSINYIIYIPVFINESNLYKHEQNSSYYNDICYTYTTENGTDITLYDRQKEFNDKNLSLCPLNCTYNGYDQINKKSICLCEFQERILFSDINYEQLVHNFSIIERKTNFDILKCYKLLFLEKGLIKNAGNYIILLIIILYIISGIYFYLKGYNIIINEINIILSNIKEDFNDNSSEIFASSKNKNIMNQSKKIFSVSNITDSNKGKTKNNIFNKINRQPNEIDKTKVENTDCDINVISYKEAVGKDKRTYLKYYSSLIKENHIIISIFNKNRDYNVFIVKICLPFFSLALCFVINALFFNDTTFHKIYIDKSNYNFEYFLPKIIYPILISIIITIIIKRLSLTQQDLLGIKFEKNKYNVKGKVLTVIKCIIIRYICFFIISILFLIFFGIIYLVFVPYIKILKNILL